MVNRAVSVLSLFLFFCILLACDVGPSEHTPSLTCQLNPGTEILGNVRFHTVCFTFLVVADTIETAGPSEHMGLLAFSFNLWT